MRLKTCKSCRQPFAPARPLQVACSPACAMALARKSTEKAAAKKRAEDARSDRAKRQRLKTIPQLKKEAQSAFNRFIRARDRAANHACICCGKPLDWGRIGGAVDAGHYRSTGSADHLRYDEDNCHAQRADCNRYGAGRAVDYRIGLLGRIGAKRVEALEADNTPRKWTRQDLERIKREYTVKARNLQNPIPPDSGAYLGACAI